MPTTAATAQEKSKVVEAPSKRTFLVVEGHMDDAEIGAGGAIGRLVAERPDAAIAWLVLAAPEPRRAAEARSSAERLLACAVHHASAPTSVAC